VPAAEKVGGAEAGDRGQWRRGGCGGGSGRRPVGGRAAAGECGERGEDQSGAGVAAQQGRCGAWPGHLAYNGLTAVGVHRRVSETMRPNRVRARCRSGGSHAARVTRRGPPPTLFGRVGMVRDAAPDEGFAGGRI